MMFNMRKSILIMPFITLVLIFGLSVSYGDTGAFLGAEFSEASAIGNNSEIGNIQTESDGSDITEASLSIITPDALTAGEALSAEVRLSGVDFGYEYVLTWFVNDIFIKQDTGITGEVFPGLKHTITYYYNMPGIATVRAELMYINEQGREQFLYAENPTVLQNYDKQHWIDEAAPIVLERITSEYTGDYTLQYALDNDLSDFEKEVWVNANGYSSRTDYLIWISLTYQRTYIFRWVTDDSTSADDYRGQDGLYGDITEAMNTGRRGGGDDGMWELIRTCIVGTGARNTPTPQGVFHINGKQADGWNMSSFRVRPVVNFTAGPNYAFHSRPYSMNFEELHDPSIGFPVSQGCVRMYDEDILFIFENIPEYTTVVVH